MSLPEPFYTHISVRDYECDQQGILNNAVYQNYLEHARHCFLKHHGLSFSEITKTGVFLVVIRAELDYLRPLRADQSCSVSVQLQKLSPIRFCFLQSIALDSDQSTVLRAKVTTAAMNPEGRPVRIPPELIDRLPLS